MSETTTQNKWERSVDKAMKSCVKVYGDGPDADGNLPFFYAHYGAAPYQLDGIFESQTEQLDMETGYKVLSNTPVISFPVSVFRKTPAAGDRVRIRGNWYRVVEPTFDGQGTVELRLQKA